MKIADYGNFLWKVATLNRKCVANELNQCDLHCGSIRVRFFVRTDAHCMLFHLEMRIENDAHPQTAADGGNFIGVEAFDTREWVGSFTNPERLASSV